MCELYLCEFDMVKKLKYNPARWTVPNRQLLNFEVHKSKVINLFVETADVIQVLLVIKLQFNFITLANY